MQIRGFDRHQFSYTCTQRGGALLAPSSLFVFFLFVHGTLTDDWEKAWFVSRVLPLLSTATLFTEEYVNWMKMVGFNQGSLYDSCQVEGGQLAGYLGYPLLWSVVSYFVVCRVVSICSLWDSPWIPIVYPSIVNSLSLSRVWVVVVCQLFTNSFRIET